MESQIFLLRTSRMPGSLSRSFCPRYATRALLRLLQPNNHDHAYFILKTISGKEFGDRDYDAWAQWLKQQAQE